MHENDSIDHLHNSLVQEIEGFRKYDRNKARYDLLPKSASLLIQYESDLFKAYYESMTSKSQEEQLATLTRLLKRLRDHCILDDIASVVAYGADKYGDDNWKKVSGTGRYWAALGRHISAMGDAGGNDIDCESGLSHAAHASTNILFLIDLITNNV